MSVPFSRAHTRTVCVCVSALVNWIDGVSVYVPAFVNVICELLRTLTPLLSDEEPMRMA